MAEQKNITPEDRKRQEQAHIDALVQQVLEKPQDSQTVMKRIRDRIEKSRQHHRFWSDQASKSPDPVAEQTLQRMSSEQNRNKRLDQLSQVSVGAVFHLEALSKKDRTLLHTLPTGGTTGGNALDEIIMGILNEEVTKKNIPHTLAGEIRKGVLARLDIAHDELHKPLGSEETEEAPTQTPATVPLRPKKQIQEGS